MPRYFEIIITGRQLAALVAAVALLVAVAFVLGVGVRGLQPQAAPPVTVAAVPTPFQQPTSAPPPPTAVPTAVPVPQPTATAAPPPTERPRPVATPAKAAGRWVQVAALGRHDQAEGVRNRVVALGYTQKQVIVQPAEGKYRVRVGPFPDVESAGRVAARLRAEGFGGSFVVNE